MTLKEKIFDAIFYNAYDFKPENVVIECEKVAEDFAIGFGEFMLTKVFVKKSVKELLEIYKQEI